MKFNLYIAFFGFALLAGGCSNQPVDTTAPEPQEGTPVTVTTVQHGILRDSLVLNATAGYLVKLPLKATTTGYIRKVNAIPGASISQGQTIFIIETKEAQALGNTINQLDSSFHFTGRVPVKAPASGQINDIAIQPGSYVQEGDILASISDVSSFCFILNLPFEWKKYLSGNPPVTLVLPDGETINALPTQRFIVMDSVSQTERVALKPLRPVNVPEGLIAKAAFLKEEHRNTCFVPRAAVLSNEMQNKFWVMKLTAPDRAVKVVIEKGIELKNNIEILAPALNDSDRVVISGAYGLPDTARVTVQPTDPQSNRD